ALVGLKLVAWPFAGPGLFREGDEIHLIEGWRYLGSAASDEELHALLDSPRPAFDRDIYKILTKYVGKMIPLSSTRSS
ncbi:MAG: DNA polymerase III subunit epsilon, partial [Rhodocyclaceae bacterium]